MWLDYETVLSLQKEGSYLTLIDWINLTDKFQRNYKINSTIDGR